MNANRDNPDRTELPADLAELGGLLDARGRGQRSGLSREALERITAMSDLQLPLSHASAPSPAVIARIGARPTHVPTHAWRIAAAVAVAAGLVAAGWLVARGFSTEADPAPGTLVQAPESGAQSDLKPSQPALLLPTPSVAPAASSPRRLAASHVERALAANTARSAATVVVALSGSVDDPSLRYHDLDDALAADFTPIFEGGSLLDGAALSYDDLTSELASLALPGAAR